MKRKLDILAWLMAAATLFATACSHDDILPADEGMEDGASQPYVELRIAVPLANPYVTRANPMGGEEGNGREQGLENEDKIHDINVFFYIEEKDTDGKGLGMDSDDDTQIIKHIYYNLGDSKDSDNTPNIDLTGENKVDNSAPDYWGKGYVYLRFKCSETELAQVKSTGINFVAIANIGPLQDITTLGALRNINFANDGTNTWSRTWDAFSNNAADMDYFLMSTAYNNDSRCGSNKISTVSSSNQNEYIGTTTLQRMYARLDLWYNNSTDANKNNVVMDADNKNIKELKYKVKNGGENIVYLTNVLPVNVMQSPSYLFKKVTAVDESWSTDNTVWNKTKLSAITSFSWGGKESPTDGPFSGTDYNDLPTNYVIERHTTDKVIGGGTNNETLTSWYGSTAVEYVSGKNLYGTTKTDCSIKNSEIGGLSAYYHDTPASSSSTNYDCNHISIISYANENTHPTDCFHSNYLTGMAFRAVFVPEKIYTGSETTTDEEGNKTITLTELGNSIESIEGGKIYRYSPTDRSPKETKSVYFTSRTAAENYGKAKDPGDSAVITEYTAIKHGDQWGFICYYNLWLRHYNDVDEKKKTDPNPNFPMEYATVRNNIYRVAVDFSGPGDPTPTMREPDTMKARIFVRKWNYRVETPIEF